ncbi:MAG: hypothetical protein JWN48_3195 [Myxococcaceae bacterium]|nr:hypothetical protein [Myxococcaceae bacterium]
MQLPVRDRARTAARCELAMSDPSASAAPSLRALQQSFWALISAPSGVRAAVADQPQHAPLLAQIVADQRGSSVERLDLYANMYFYRLRDNLAQDFPKLAQVLGEGTFHNLITDYLLVCPSKHPSVRNLGQQLSEFLRSHALSTERSWLADLARLEWARVDVADRADQALFTLQDLQAAAASGFAELSLRSIVAHERVPVESAVHVTWRSLQQHEAPSEPGVSGPTTLLVWRQADLHVHHRPLEPEESSLLSAVAEGTSFVELCERLLAVHGPEEAAQRALTLVASWARTGLLARPS